MANTLFSLFSTVFLLSALLVFSSSTEASPFDYDKGVALRQTILVMKWPSNFTGNGVAEKSFGMSETRSRLWSSVDTGYGRVNAAIESKAFFISSSETGAGSFGSGGSLLGQSRPLKHWDWTTKHLNDESTAIESRIDRLDAVFHVGIYDIDIGRQPLSMGTSHFVGVLDVVAPFAPGDLDATYKPGVDAVRVRRGIGMTGEAEIIAVGADEWSDGALLGRTRASFGMFDVEVIGGRFRRRGFGGIGWEGGSNPIGFWGEAALFGRREEQESVRSGWSEAAFSGVTGLDYYIQPDFVVGGGVLYQDFGVRDPEDLPEVYNEAPFREGWVFLGSAGYGVLTLSKELHPLVQADVSGLVNLVDSSTLWQPVVTINTGDNTDISFYGWIATGKDTKTDGGTVETRSEFGMMPDGGGLYARWFF